MAAYFSGIWDFPFQLLWSMLELCSLAVNTLKRIETPGVCDVVTVLERGGLNQELE